MGAMGILAEALRYPIYGRIEVLQAGVMELTSGPVKKHLSQFLKRVQDLSLGEWEELYTRTLDLNPFTAPYVGFQTWGDSYQRGNFMATLNRAIQEHQVERDGELPDHLVPILRYLDSTSDPIPELVEVLKPALEKMIKELRKTEANNPYLHLLRAILESGQAQPEKI